MACENGMTKQLRIDADWDNIFCGPELERLIFPYPTIGRAPKRGARDHCIERWMACSDEIDFGTTIGKNSDEIM